MTTPVDVAGAIARLRAGGVCVFPTETFYGLGAAALDGAAVAAAAACKGRDADKPIAVVIHDVAVLPQVVARVPAAAERLIARFWPGPLTLVLPARPGLPAPLTAGGAGIGVRVSSHPVARALAAGVGGPITATSANPAGAEPALDVATAERYFGAALAYVDGGPLAGGSGSTVVVVGDEAARVVRAGAIAIDVLRDVLGSFPIH